MGCRVAKILLKQEECYLKLIQVDAKSSGQYYNSSVSEVQYDNATLMGTANSQSE